MYSINVDIAKAMGLLSIRKGTLQAYQQFGVRVFQLRNQDIGHSRR